MLLSRSQLKSRWLKIFNVIFADDFFWSVEHASTEISWPDAAAPKNQSLSQVTVESCKIMIKFKVELESNEVNHRTKPQSKEIINSRKSWAKNSNTREP